MKSVKITLDEMIKGTSPAIQAEVAIEFAISNRISKLMELCGLSKIRFAKSLDKRPSEVTNMVERAAQLYD